MSQCCSQLISGHRVRRRCLVRIFPELSEQLLTTQSFLSFTGPFSLSSRTTESKVNPAPLDTQCDTDHILDAGISAATTNTTS